MPNNLWKGTLFNKSLLLHKYIARKYGRDVYVVSGEMQLADYEPRVATIELMSREIYRYGVEGNTAELGVYRGEFAMMINHYFPDRKLYLFDTFGGFDARDVEADMAGNFSDGDQDFTQTSEEIVLSRMEHRENCIIRKGWFPDTAQGVDDKFCFVSIDADLYQPTLAGLRFFYPRLVHGGVIMIHDFNSGYKGVRPAVRDFCDESGANYICITDKSGSAVITK